MGNLENTEQQNNLFKEVDIRRDKIRKIKKLGINPYANKFETTHTLPQAVLLEVGNTASIAGRIVFKRAFGKFMFIKISDIYGSIQVSLSLNDLGDENYAFFNDFIDLGDYVGFSGEMYLTKTGELTLKTHSFKLLSKAILPLPDKYHGLTDIELRYRQRYLDLIANDETKKVFLTRSRVVSYIRNFLNNNDFLEVETPVLQNVASGAAAKPFETKHNVLDKKLYLRIAPELFLKQVVAGGIPRVYEIGKNYRNEGMSPQHLQEFTMLEWYASYWDYKDNIDFVIELIKDVVLKVHGEHKFTYQNTELDFGGEWERVNYIEKLNELVGADILTFETADDFKAHLKTLNMFPESELKEIVSLGGLFDYVYKKKIRPSIVQPTIVYNYPNLVPLARPSDDNEKVIEMFQVLVVGTEIVKSYSELVDPEIQRAGFEEQMKNKAKGDDEAFVMDEDFMLAMEHGMPPMSGLGLGIDRFVAILTNQETLRDVVLFPNMK